MSYVQFSCEPYTAAAELMREIKWTKKLCGAFFPVFAIELQFFDVSFYAFACIIFWVNVNLFDLQPPMVLHSSECHSLK